MNNLRLKSLELNGYKTFASRTLFDFAGQITAIVGPNGSGKSNIADALRWVLGEQSYVVLRGRKTEDMIFSGADKRPRAGMASVTITFDNSEGWLPIDFSEVAITRRAYRDGQNEYLINQQKVRLRDVTELLSKSALAERTYTVIGQGLVDTALTLRSDERRRLFEEAAGIGLYRARKDQSERRLDTTMRNLERVEDILAELKPRVRSLEKQAARAEEHSRLRADLRATLREWYGFHWNRAQAELGALRQEADSREEKLGQARQKQAELSQDLNELRSRAQELRIQLNGWHRKLSELHASREGAAKGLAVADERQRALAERREALAEEKQRLQIELAALSARLQEAEQDAARYQTEVDEAKGQLGEAQRVLRERLAVRNEKQATTQGLRDRIAHFERQQNTSVAQRDQLVARIERNQTELAELERAITGMDGDTKSLKDQANSMGQAINQADKALADLQAQKELSELAHAETLSEMEQLAQQRRELEARQARLHAEIKVLEEADLAATGFAQGARLVLQDARSKGLGLGTAILGSELRVSDEYEAAIAAALGSFRDAVLLADEKESEKALEMLAAQNASGALLPLKELHLGGRVQAAAADGLVGVAADLVEVAESMRPAVEFLLGRVLVVRDRKAARRLLASVPEALHVVTLQGEVFHRSGPIEVRSAKTATALARPREERQLRSQLNDTERELAKLETGTKELDERLSANDQVRKQTQIDVDRAQHSLAEIQREAQGVALEAQQLERQLEWFRSQQRMLDAERAEAQAQTNKLSETEATLVLQIAQSKNNLEEHLHAELEETADEQQAQVAHWEMRLAVAQRALQEAQRRSSERKQLLQRVESQLASQQQRNAEAEMQVQALKAEKMELGRQGGDVDEELETIQAQISPAEVVLADLDKQLEQQQSDEGQALQGLSSAERAHTQVQIALGRQQEALEGLRSRIEDDFGLVAFQYEEGVSGPTPLPLGDLVEQLPKID
ncbi:MAG: AAA family ATPase, partial [Anaerolineales bacterium]